MHKTTNCPTPDSLKQFVTGELSEAGANALVGHLEGCPTCLGELHKLKDSTVSVDLKAAGTVPDASPSPRFQEMMSKLIAMGLSGTQGDSNTSKSSVASFAAVTIEQAPSPVDHSELSFLSPPQAPDELGRLSGYRVLRVLGAGGMGLVLEAEDVQLKRRIALKVMKPEVAKKEQNRLRFIREAEAAGKVSHDFIVPIFQVGSDNGVPFIAMPFLKGMPLDVRLKRGPMEMPEILRIGRQIAQGLATAHAHGLIHRDIKPGNIWLEEVQAEDGETHDGMKTFRVKILDFGLARLSGDGDNITQSGTILGTPAYMSPEQARAKSVDHRADLWSLGCILYEMTTGQRPFTGPDTLAIFAALALDDPIDPRSLNPNMPPALVQLIKRLLEKDPEKRPASASEVAETLRKLREEPTEPIMSALLVDEWYAAPSIAKQKPRSWPMAMVLLLLLIGGGFAAYQFAFKTAEGTLIVDVDEDADVRFQKGKLVIYENNQPRYELKPSDRNKSLPPGQYMVQVESVDGLKIDTPEFKLDKRGKARVRVVVDPGKSNVAKKDPESKKETEIVKKPEPKKGPPNYALEFRGTGEYVRAPSNFALQMDEPWTVEAWVNLPEMQSLPDGGLTLFAGSEQFFVAVWNTQGGIRWYGSSGAFHKRAEFERWVHVAMVHDGSTLTLFVDGEPQKTPARVNLPQKQLPITLGPNEFPATSGRTGFMGMIDEMRVSSVARYVDKFTPKRRLEVDDKTLVLHHCDEGKGTYLKDASDNGHETQFVGARWVKVDNAPSEGSKADAPEPGLAKTPERRAADRVLSLEGAVRINGQLTDIKSAAELPKEPFDLTCVNLHGNPKVQNEDLECFKDCIKLTELDLSHTRVSNAGLVHFKNCKRLKKLQLGYTPIGDAGLQNFIDCEDLIHLNLADLNVTDQGLGNFKDCEKLNTLDLRATKVSSSGLANFKDARHLRIVYLTETKIGDAALVNFKNSKEQLRNLDLLGTEVTDEGLKHLAIFTKLERLDLRKTKVTKAGIEYLQEKLPQCKIVWDK